MKQQEKRGRPAKTHNKLGGMSCNQIAELLGVSCQAVQKWLKNKVPAERARAFSHITGIPRHELRPDLWEPPSSSESP